MLTKKELADTLGLSCVEKYFLAWLGKNYNINNLYVRSFVGLNKLFDAFAHGATYENYCDIERLQDLAEEYGDDDAENDDDRGPDDQLIAQGLDDAADGRDLALDDQKVLLFGRGPDDHGVGEVLGDRALEGRLALLAPFVRGGAVILSVIIERFILRVVSSVRLEMHIPLDLCDGCVLAAVVVGLLINAVDIEGNDGDVGRGINTVEGIGRFVDVDGHGVLLLDLSGEVGEVVGADIIRQRIGAGLDLSGFDGFIKGFQKNRLEQPQHDQEQNGKDQKAYR